MRILWDSLFNDVSSLGILSRHLVGQLIGDGHTVHAAPWPESDMGCVPSQARAYREEPVDVAVRVCDPYSALLGLWRQRIGRTGLYLPLLYFDGGVLDAPLVQTFNANLSSLLTFSRFTKSMLVRSGVRSRIEVLPLGVDPAESALAEGPRRDDRLELVYAGYLGFRKGLDILMRVITKRFADDQRLHLTVKSVGAAPSEYAPASNVKYVGDALDRRAWFRFLGEFHYFVAPTRMESFGMVGLEAAATGTSMIYPLQSACADYAAAMPAALALTSGRWVEGENENRRTRQQRFWQVDDDDLTATLEYVLQTKAYGYDRTAVREYAVGHSWARSAARFASIVESIGYSKG